MESPGTLDAHRLDGEQPSQADIDLYRVLSADISAGVAVVSTSLRKRDYAATVTAFLSVSDDPPTMLVSLYAGSRIGEAVAATGTWALSLLRSRHQGAADWLASPGTPVEGLLARVPYRRGPATGSVILDGSIAYFELRTVAIHPAATHLLVVGEVVALGGDAPGSEVPDPLIHFASAYHRLAL
ncbi:flavin reductase family protein [Pseudarthrobacter sp. O4]|uniref:flavin reductase family protein n=1 Tax=Pseudarthrobacter sp. O4 TaxID=3418417 RepID=UPI003CFAF32B